MKADTARCGLVVPAILCAAVLSPPVAAEDDTADLQSLLATPVYAASKYQQSVADAPAAVTILGQGEIRAFGWRTFAEILEAVRGVYTRYDRGYAYISVRGLGRPGDYSSRLLVLLDGVRLNDNIYDAVLAGTEFPLDVDLIDRVEFIPGPGSAVHGSNAVLGTVNIVTRSASNIRGRNAAAALDTLRGWKLSASSASEHEAGSLLAAASFEGSPGQTLAFPEFDTATSPGGIARGLDAESVVRGYLRFESGDFSWTGLASRRSKEIPNAPYGLVFGDPAAVWVDSYGMVGVSWHPGTVDGSGWYAQSSLANYKYGDHGRYEPEGELYRYENFGLWWHGELNHTWHLSDGNLLLAGVELQQDFVQEISGQQLEPDVGEIDAVNDKGARFGVYISDDISLGAHWKLGVGGRADRNAAGDWTATPRMSLLWHPIESLVLKALSGKAYRDPNVYERAPLGLDSQWNANLQRERVNTNELAANWTVTDRFRLSASVYRSDVTRMIEQAADPDTLVVDYRNVGSARARGAELEGEYIAPSGLRVRSSLARQRATDSSDVELSNSPRWLFKFHATTPLPRVPVRAALELLGRSSRITEARARLSPQLVTNLSFTWNSPGQSWSASVDVRNLFDKRLYDPTSTEYPGDRVEQNGREATLRAHFSF